MTTTILPTRNEAWGFFGTMQLGGADPMQSWNAASAMIADETEASAEGVRDFLDSRHGRHFADDVLSALADLGRHRLEAAIEAAVARWQGWRIGRQTERGFPTSPAGSPTSRSSTRPPPDGFQLRTEPPRREARLGVVEAPGRSRVLRTERDDPMTKLSDTQAIILSAAAQRDGGNLLPLPGSLRGGAAVKVVGALLSRGLAREEVIDRAIPADGALNTIWRNEDDGRAVLLKITPEGLAAIGVETAGEAVDVPTAPAEPAAAEPAGEAVDYRFNEGTNSAGQPAAGLAAATPDASKTRGRPKKVAQPTEPAAAPTKRGRSKKAAAEATSPAAPRKARDDTKQAQLIAMLRRKEGATIAQIVAATGWQPHTVRGAFAGALKKKLGLTVTSEKVEGIGRVYRLDSEAGR